MVLTLCIKLTNRGIIVVFWGVLQETAKMFAEGEKEFKLKMLSFHLRVTFNFNFIVVMSIKEVLVSSAGAVIG